MIPAGLLCGHRKGRRRRPQGPLSLLPGPVREAVPIPPPGEGPPDPPPDPDPDPPAGPFPNGYVARRLLVVPGALIRPGSDLPRFPVLVRIARADLRSTVNSGLVQNGTHRDIRFETLAGVKLPHEELSYDAILGVWLGWVRLPLVTSAADTFWWCYYGKEALAGSEQDAAGVWADYLAVWNTATGVDRSGHGRHLTPTGVTTSSLIGPCGSFNGSTSRLKRSDATWLNGHGALTMRAVLQPSATMLGTNRGWLAQGDSDVRDSVAGLGMRYMAENFAGDTFNCLHAKLQAIATADAYRSTAGNLHTTAMQQVSFVWEAGQQPHLYVDGEEPESSGSQVIEDAGALTVMDAGAFYLGRGTTDPFTTGGGYAGLLDEVYVRAEAVSAAWAHAEARNIADPEAFVGIGAAEGFGDNLGGCVASPLRASVARGVASDVDVAAYGYDPQALPLSLSAVASPVNGGVAVQSGQARFTPTAGYTGLARFDFTLSNGDSASQGRAVLLVVPEAEVVAAVDDEVVCPANGSISFDPRGNDTPASGLTITALGTASHGTPLLIGGTEVLYTPDSGYEGPDSFSYTISDGEVSDVGSIAVTVGGGGSTPGVVANDDAFSTSPGQAIDVSPLVNDTANTGELRITSYAQPPAGQGTVVPTPAVGVDPYALLPENYVSHQPANATGVTLTWLSGGGFEAKAGSTVAAAKLIRVWCKTAPPSGDCTFRFRFRRLDTLPDSGADSEGTFALFGPRYRGTASGVPTDPTKWPASQYQGVSGQVDASDTIYRTKGKGYRARLANQNDNTAINGRIVFRTYEGPGDTQYDPTSPSPQPTNHFQTLPDVDYDFVGARVGNVITCTLTRVSNGTTKTATFNNADFGPNGLGVGGWMSWTAARGRHIRVTPTPGQPIVQDPNDPGGDPGPGPDGITSLRYTPPAGFVGEAVFSYTASNGSESDTATVRVTVGTGSSGQLPTPLRTVQVPEDFSTIQAALNHAASTAGTHVSVANGSYAGFSTVRAGTQANPIVVKARNKGQVRLTSDAVLEDADNWLHGVEVDAAAVNLLASRTKLLRSSVHDTEGIAVGVGGGDQVEVAYNAIYRCKDRGISVDAAGDQDNPTRPWIHHNHIRDFLGVAGTNVHEPLQLGQGKNSSDASLQALAEWNLFERAEVDSECISCKSSDNTIRFNTMLDCAAHFTNRHGERNKWYANWLEDTNGMRCHDRNNEYLGNRLRNSSNGLQVMAGNVSPSNWPGSGSHPAAQGTILAGNDCDKTKIGHAYSGHNVAASGTKVEAHSGNITYDKHTGTTNSSTTNRTIPQPRKLTPAEVGPNAP